MNRNTVVVAAALLAMAVAACGAQSGDGSAVSAPATGGPAPAAGMCPQDQPDCVDTPQLLSEEPVALDETAIKQFRRDAKYYLGRKQSELTEFIRIARIDDEQFMLTEDYRVGRITVELDTLKGDSQPVVTSATVELPDGPETFKLKK